MRKSRVRVAVAMFVAAAFVAGCGSDGGSDGGGSVADSAGDEQPADTTPGTGPVDTTAGTEADAVATDPDASLTFTYSVGGLTLDPAKAPSFNTATYLRPIYDTLITQDEDGALGPGLAEEFEFVDDTTFVLHLRDGVVFQDGTNFDADAVKTNLDRTMTIEGGTQVSLLTSVESIEVTDPLTVQLNLSQPDATIPAVLTTFPGMMISPELISSGVALTSVASGTGPYMLVSHDPEAGTEYARFPDSWAPEEAGVAHLFIINNADSGQRVNQLKTGEAQAANIDANQVEQVESDGLNVQAKSSENVWFVALNSATPALQDPKVREAINLAIDRQALADGLDFGLAEPTLQLQAPGQPGYNDAVTPEYDLERAQQLLSESGVDPSIRFLSQAVPVIQSFQEAVAGMLTEAGFDVEIVVVDNAQIRAERDSGNWDLTVSFWPGAADPWMSYNALLAEGSEFNPQAPLPPEVADLMDQVRADTDDSTRVALLEDLAAAVSDENLIAVLTRPQRPTASTPEVVDFRGNVDAVPWLRGAAIAAD